jgi:hypothetical protein
MIGFSALLMLVAGLWGRRPFIIAVIGLALLCLRWFARGRPAAASTLRILGGLALPWWLGHGTWAPLTGESLLLSLLWGLAYTSWAALEETRTWTPLLWVDLAQAGVAVFFLLFGQPVVGSVIAFALLGQVLLQIGLWRKGRWDRVSRQTWPFAAVGLLLSGLALGGWRL